MCFLQLQKSLILSNFVGEKGAVNVCKNICLTASQGQQGLVVSYTS